MCFELLSLKVKNEDHQRLLKYRAVLLFQLVAVEMLFEELRLTSPLFPMHMPQNNPNVPTHLDVLIGHRCVNVCVKLMHLSLNWHR